MAGAKKRRGGDGEKSAKGKRVPYPLHPTSFFPSSQYPLRLSTPATQAIHLKIPLLSIRKKNISLIPENKHYLGNKCKRFFLMWMATLTNCSKASFSWWFRGLFWKGAATIFCSKVLVENYSIWTYGALELIELIWRPQSQSPPWLLPSLPTDILWGSFGGEMNAWQTNPKGRLWGGWLLPGFLHNM